MPGSRLTPDGSPAEKTTFSDAPGDITPWVNAQRSPFTRGSAAPAAAAQQQQQPATSSGGSGSAAAVTVPLSSSGADEGSEQRQRSQPMTSPEGIRRSRAAPAAAPGAQQEQQQTGARRSRSTSEGVAGDQQATPEQPSAEELEEERLSKLLLPYEQRACGAPARFDAEAAAVVCTTCDKLLKERQTGVAACTFCSVRSSPKGWFACLSCPTALCTPCEARIRNNVLYDGMCYVRCAQTNKVVSLRHAASHRTKHSASAASATPRSTRRQPSVPLSSSAPRSAARAGGKKSVGEGKQKATTHIEDAAMTTTAVAAAPAVDIVHDAEDDRAPSVPISAGTDAAAEVAPSAPPVAERAAATRATPRLPHMAAEDDDDDSDDVPTTAGTGRASTSSRFPVPAGYAPIAPAAIDAPRPSAEELLLSSAAQAQREIQSQPLPKPRKAAAPARGPMSSALLREAAKRGNIVEIRGLPAHATLQHVADFVDAPGPDSVIRDGDVVLVAFRSRIEAFAALGRCTDDLYDGEYRVIAHMSVRTELPTTASAASRK